MEINASLSFKGDKEAARDGDHGRHEEVQGVQHGSPGARSRSTLRHPREEGEGRRGRRRLQARQEVNGFILSMKRLLGVLIKRKSMNMHCYILNVSRVQARKWQILPNEPFGLRLIG